MLLPDSVSVEAPDLLRSLAPLMMPDRVASAELLTVASPLSAMALSMVVASVICNVEPAASVTLLLPRLLSLATDRVPADTVVVPE